MHIWWENCKCGFGKINGDFLANWMTNSAYARVCSAFYLSSPGLWGQRRQLSPHVGGGSVTDVGPAPHCSSLLAASVMFRLLMYAETLWQSLMRKLGLLGKKVIPHLFCLLCKWAFIHFLCFCYFSHEQGVNFWIENLTSKSSGMI